MGLRIRELFTTSIHSGTLLKTVEVALLPAYLGKRTSRVRYLYRDGCNLAGGCHTDRNRRESGSPSGHQNNSQELAGTKTEHGHTNCRRRYQKDGRIHKSQGDSLNVRVKGRIPRCYKCGLKSNVKAYCPPPHKKDKEETDEKGVGVSPPLKV